MGGHFVDTIFTVSQIEQPNDKRRIFLLGLAATIATAGLPAEKAQAQESHEALKMGEGLAIRNMGADIFYQNTDLIKNIQECRKKTEALDHLFGKGGVYEKLFLLTETVGKQTPFLDEFIDGIDPNAFGLSSDEMRTVPLNTPLSDKLKKLRKTIQSLQPISKKADEALEEAGCKEPIPTS